MSNDTNITKEHYHHGTLKKDLIDKGIVLLNQEGYEGFSLRKLANICGVSHSAPYKHFKSKDELIGTIALEVNNSFTTSLKEAVKEYPNNPATQLLEMGKQYVKFMVENPEILKFIFLNGNHQPVLVNSTNFTKKEDCPFSVFEKSATDYLKFMDTNPEDRVTDILTMWSLVHGIAVLIVNNSIAFKENYLDFVEKMLKDKLIPQK